MLVCPWAAFAGATGLDTGNRSTFLTEDQRASDYMEMSFTRFICIYNLFLEAKEKRQISKQLQV